MGLMFCEKHGYQGIFDGISEDMVTKIYNGVAMSNDDVKYIKTTHQANEYPHLRYFISKELFDFLGLKEDTIDGQKGANDFYNLIKSHITIICIECLKNFIAHNGINVKLSNT